MAERKASLELNIDSSAAVKSAKALESALDKLGSRAGRVQQAIDKLGAKKINVQFAGIGIAKAEKSVRDLQQAIDKLGAKKINVQFSGTGFAQAQKLISDLRRSVGRIGNVNVTAGPTSGLSRLQADLAAIHAKIAAINAMRVGPQQGSTVLQPRATPSPTVSRVPASQFIGPRVETMADIRRQQAAADRAEREADAARRQAAAQQARAAQRAAQSQAAALRRQQLQATAPISRPGSSVRTSTASAPRMPDMTGISRAVGGLSDSFKKLEGSVLSVQGVLSGLGVAAVAKDIAQTGAAYENLQKGLDVASNSATQGKAEFARLKAETDRLGLSTLATGKEYVNFVASVSGSTVNVEKAKDTFFAVAQAMAILGKSPADASRAFTALSQMASKGKITAEELTGQLAEQLPGAFALTAKALGMSTAELSQAMEKGQVSIQSFFNVFSDAVRNKFPADKIETATASFGRFSNAMDEAKRTIADGGFLKAAAAGAEELAKFLNTADGKKLAEELGTVLKGAVDDLITAFRFLSTHVDDVKHVIQALIAVKIGSWILGIVGNLASLAMAFRVLGVAIMANPLIAIGATLAAGAAGLIALNSQVQSGTAAWADHAAKMASIQQLHAQLATAQGTERTAIRDKITALRDEAKAAVISIQEQIDKRKELLALEQQSNPGGPMSAFGPMQDQTAAYGLQDEGALNQSLKAAQDVVTTTTNVLEGKTPEGKRKQGAPRAGTAGGAGTAQPVKVPTTPKVTGENIGEKFVQQRRELSETIKSQTEMSAAYGLGTDAVEAQSRKLDILNQVQALNPKYSKAQVAELEKLISALYDAEQATKFSETAAGMDEARSQTIALTDATMALAHGTEGSSAAMIDEQARIQARNAAIALGVTHDQERVASLESLYKAEARANAESANANAIKTINQSTDATNKQTEALSLEGEKRAVVLATLEEEAKLISENIPLNSALAEERLKAAGAGALAQNRNKQVSDIEDMQASIDAIAMYSDAMALNGDAQIRRNAEIEKMVALERAGQSATNDLGQSQIKLAGDLAVAENALNQQNDALQDLANSGLTTTQQMRSLSYDGLMHMEDALVSLITGTKSVKEAFHDMAKAVANDLARMAVRQAITIPLAGMLGMGMMPMMHSGGIVGKETTGSRMMPGSIPGVQRYHSGKMPGIGGGEVPTILNRNEGVFTPAQMASLGPAGGGATSVFSPVINVTQPKGATDAEGQTFGKAIVRQMQQMVDDRIGHAYRPGGIRNQSGM
jgi:tape measure domain-containing protein